MPGPAAGRPPARRSTPRRAPAGRTAPRSPIEPRERGERLPVVGVEVREELRPGRTAHHVERHERIADEDRVRDGRWSAALPAVCPGTWMTLRRPRHVERRAVAERRDLRDRRRPEPAATKAEPQELEQRDRPDLAAALVLRLELAARERGIGLVDGGSACRARERIRSAKPMWSLWACVRRTACTSSMVRPIADELGQEVAEIGRASPRRRP